MTTQSTIPDTLIEINDPEIDPATIMREIRERVRERRDALGADDRVFPKFGVAAYPEEPSDASYDPNLYHYLRLANENYAQIETDLILADSPATQVPVLGKLWGLIRRQMHELVQFYVNRAVTHQVTMDRYLVSVLNRLTAQNQEQAREIEALRAELATLRAPRGEG